MKRAFSMIELIFVIFIIAILSIIGYLSMPNFTLINDTNYISMQIKRVQAKAIGNNHFIFGDGGAWKSNYYPDSCIDIDKNSLQVTKKSSGGYSINPNTTISISGLTIGAKNRLCFDYLGRVYDGDYNHLITSSSNPINISLTYRNEVKNILIMPYSGYVIIK